MIVIPDCAATYSLDQWIDERTTYYRLYVVDIVLDHTTTAASFIEASFPGYDLSLVTTWTNAIIFAGVATSWADPCVWTRAAGPGGPQTVYGYYVTDGTGDLLLWCERAPASITVAQAGDRVAVQPRYQWGALPS